MNILDRVWRYNYPPIAEDTSMVDQEDIVDYISTLDDLNTNHYHQDFHMRIPQAIPVKK